MVQSSVSASAVENGVGMEVAFTRVFDAPRRLVFQVWTDPRHLAKWWGPHGFTNPRCEWEARPGASIRIDMRGPDGRVYPMSGKFEQVVEPERLVFTSSALDELGKPIFEILNTVTFAEKNGKTTMNLTARVVRSTPNAPQYLQGMEQGWSQSLDRLTVHVAKAHAADSGSPGAGRCERAITVSRVFNAPREVVWNAWTDAKQLVQWWGPRGFTTTIETMDLRPGGAWELTMHGPDGVDYPNHCVFAEVKKPERIVYTLQGGRKGEAGVNFEATWTFEELGKQTRLTMVSVFPTIEECDIVVNSYGAIEGGKDTLERLAEHLAKEATVPR
jgi:uncharacterized protein YndB with AHSA1/START domain